MAFQIDKIGLFTGYTAAPVQPRATQGIGIGFGQTTPIKESIQLPKKSPFGHMSPVVQNETMANKLDLFA